MKLGTWVGLLMLGTAPASGQDVGAGVTLWQQGNHAAAVAIWAPLAARGDPDAAFNLGQAYRLGKGVGIDLPRAQSYLEIAARKNHVDAATTLGMLLFQNGNRTAGLRWLRQAAGAGEPRAMLMYGTALFNVDGVARDPVRAYALVSRAAAQGLAPARETLLELDGNLLLDQRQQGLALAKSMVAKAAPPATRTARPVSAAATTPAARATAKPAPLAPSSAGPWRIQLGAFSQRGPAEALLQQVRGRVGGEPFLVPAGKIVRLQVGPFASRAAAAAACAALAPRPCFAVPAR